MGSVSSSAGRTLTRAEMERVFELAARGSAGESQARFSAQTILAIAREVGLSEEAVRDALVQVTAPDRDLAGRTVGRYRVLRRLGGGAGGVVYEAEDPELGRRLALKVFAGRGGAAADARFRREAKALARIRHPHVVAVHDTGLADGAAYLAMELCEGGALDRFVGPGTPADIPVVTRWLREAVLGLREAARHGLLHRDIKPSNLLLDGEGRVKVADFGLAKLTSEMDDTLTRQGDVLGTPLYMSPEQARGAPADGRSDIYSLGAAFFHILAGRPPFEATGAAAVVLARRLVEDSPPLRSVAPGIPEPLAAVVDRMLRRDASARFADYDEVLGALEGRAALAVASAEPSGWKRALAVVRGPERIVIRRRAPGAPSEVHNTVVAALLKSQLEPDTVGEVASVWQLDRKPLMVEVVPDPEGARAELNYKIGRRRFGDLVAGGLCIGLVGGVVQAFAAALSTGSFDVGIPLGFYGGGALGVWWQWWAWNRKVRKAGKYLEMVSATPKGLPPVTPPAR